MSVKKKSFLILFIVVLLLTTVFVTPVSAEWYDSVSDFQDFENKAYDKLGNKNYLKKGVYDATKWRYVGVAALFDNNTEIFKSDWLMNQTGGKMQDYIKDISSAVLVIGRMFCLLYFLLSLMESATRDSFTIEVFIKSFTKFALIFVIFSPSTIATITEFMAAIEDKMFVAIGRPKFVTADMVKEGAVVIDVGVNRDPETKKLCGDVDFAAIEPKASAITPVPGGVGPMTITCLMENTIECFVRKMEK